MSRPCTLTASIQIESSLPSEVAAISSFVDNVIVLLTQCGCIAGREGDVEIALREAVNNAVVHGNHEDPQKCVSVECRCIPGEIFVAVRDEGQGFDFSKVPDPTTPTTVYSARGRGIYLMRAFMDEVRFEEGGSLVQMRKRVLPGDQRIPQNEAVLVTRSRNTRS